MTAEDLDPIKKAGKIYRAFKDKKELFEINARMIKHSEDNIILAKDDLKFNLDVRKELLRLDKEEDERRRHSKKARS